MKANQYRQGQRLRGLVTRALESQQHWEMQRMIEQNHAIAMQAIHNVAEREAA